MENFDAKSYMRRYQGRLILCLLAILAIHLYLIFTLGHEMWINIPLLLIYYAATRLTNGILYNKYVLSHLARDLDPIKFKALTDATKGTSYYALERVVSSYYSGDYQTTVNICAAKLADRRYKKMQFQYLSFLARVYFNIGDLEKLRTVCEKFDSESACHRKRDKIRRQFAVMRFCSLYLSGDHAACKALYEELLGGNVHGIDELGRIQLRYSYAIACFKTGDTAAASDIFADIAARAPKLPYAEYSRRYLECIAEGRDYEPARAEGELLPDEGFSMPRAAGRINPNVKLIVLCVCLLIILICSVVIANNNAAINSEIEKAVDAVYDDFEVLEYIPVEADGVQISLLCICETEDGLVIGDVVRRESGRVYYTNIMERPVNAAVYHRESTSGGWDVSYAFYYYKKDIPEDAIETVRLKTSDGTMYFCIIDITAGTVSADGT